jgi:hypothetical protein
MIGGRVHQRSRRGLELALCGIGVGFTGLAFGSPIRPVCGALFGIVVLGVLLYRGLPSSLEMDLRIGASVVLVVGFWITVGLILLSSGAGLSTISCLSASTIGIALTWTFLPS